MKPPRILASVFLLGLLLQVFLFYLGLRDPVLLRALTFWDKTREQRLAASWQPGLVLEGLAAKFPADAKIYMMHPQALVHWNSIYYFYPRRIVVTMKNAIYHKEQEYTTWNEKPTEQWLMTNGYTHVMDLQDGLRVLEVRPGLQRQLDALERHDVR
jgi:hypothetical protein